MRVIFEGCSSYFDDSLAVFRYTASGILLWVERMQLGGLTNGCRLSSVCSEHSKYFEPCSIPHSLRVYMSVKFCHARCSSVDFRHHGLSFLPNLSLCFKRGISFLLARSSSTPSLSVWGRRSQDGHDHRLPSCPLLLLHAFDKDGNL